MRRKEDVLDNIRHYDIPCSFTDIKRDEFAEIAYRAGKGIRRLTINKVEDAEVFCTVRSQSDLSEWDFSLGFNDFGHITGAWWKYGDTRKSLIPDRLAEKICNELKPYTEKYYCGYGYSTPGEELFVENELQKDREREAELERIQQRREQEIRFQQEMRRRVKEENKAQRRAWRRRNRKPLSIAFLIAVIIIGSVGLIHHQKQLRTVNLSSEAFIGMNCEDAERQLQKAGFDHVHKMAQNDLSYDELDEVGKVIEVDIDGNNHFAAGSKFRHDSYVKVLYHAADEIFPPMSLKDAKGKEYKEVLKAFQEAGFGNVTTIPEYKPFTKITKREGKVLAVSIDNIDDYSTSHLFTVDKKVVITYRTADKKYK